MLTEQCNAELCDNPEPHAGACDVCLTSPADFVGPYGSEMWHQCEGCGDYAGEYGDEEDHFEHPWSIQTIWAAIYTAQLNQRAAMRWANEIAEIAWRFVQDGDEDPASAAAMAVVSEMESDQQRLFVELDAWDLLEDYRAAGVAMGDPNQTIGELIASVLCQSALFIAEHLTTPEALWEARGLDPETAAIAGALDTLES